MRIGVDRRRLTLWDLNGSMNEATMNKVGRKWMHTGGNTNENEGCLGNKDANVNMKGNERRRAIGLAGKEHSKSE